MLRRVQFLRHRVPPGALRDVAVRPLRGGGGEVPRRGSGFQGLYPRRGRPHGELPPPLLQKAADGGNVSVFRVEGAGGQEPPADRWGGVSHRSATMGPVGPARCQEAQEQSRHTVQRQRIPSKISQDKSYTTASSKMAKP